MGDKIWFVIWSHTAKPLMNLTHLNWAQIKAYCLDSCCTVSCPNVLVRKTNDTASPAFFNASSFKRTRHVRILNDKGCNSAAKTSNLKAVKTSKHFTALVLEPNQLFGTTQNLTKSIHRPAIFSISYNSTWNTWWTQRMRQHFPWNTCESPSALSSPRRTVDYSSVSRQLDSFVYYLPRIKNTGAYVPGGKVFHS